MTLTTNTALLTDLYQLTMMNGYVEAGIADRMACFDLFFRQLPFGGGYAVAAGLEDALDYVANLRFSREDIDYLASLNLFPVKFLEQLSEFRFTGEINALPEGTLVFPFEPILQVRGTLLEAQFLETALLNIVNFQTLIATKAARIWESSDRAPVIEFGLRRAQGPNGGMSATRAAYIGGCEATSNILAGKEFGIPVSGTMAHSWIMAHPDELTAFRAYAKIYPNKSIFLVDTFDTLREGIPHAITVGKEMKSQGHSLMGIRLDSGDLAYLSIEARQMLNEAGLHDVKIVASNDLDEWIVEALRHQGSKIDIWGVGTKLVTAAPDSALGGVYKLVALADERGEMRPRIKISQNVEKTTTPGEKAVYRIFDCNANMIADVMALSNEPPPSDTSVVIHHPQIEYKFSRIDTIHRIESLLVTVFAKGKRLLPHTDIQKIRARTKAQLDSLHSTHRRLTNPHSYRVGFSKTLRELKGAMIKENMERV
ncbi:MAG: nicotinate phosphoribosyltransferase [Candidatus Riflebacteria bacterium]|nr:nicotinate phosphoribosyltransferase [Candidatus Riflebacteria bacterium]